MLESIDSGNASPNYNLERQDTIESYDLNISENWKQLLAKYKDDPGNLNHIKDLFRAIEDNQLRIDKKLAQLNGAQLITVEDLLRYSEIINERDTKLQKDIYTTATKDKPVNAFFNLKEYETSAYIDDIIATIFETDPSIFMGSQASKYAPNDETIKAKISKIQTKIDKNVLLNLAKSQPGNILRLIDFYAQQPYCKEIIAKAKEFYEEEDIIHPYTELFITHRFSYDIYQYLSLHTVSLDIGKQTHVITEKHVSFLS
ncbi:MAG: hypothetical protein Q8O99_03810 [bacterium]|nr:hypothetical protein [bacterium]